MKNKLIGASFQLGPLTILADGTSRLEGKFQWTPNYNQSGVYATKFVATDNKGGPVESDDININVKNGNEPPKMLFLISLEHIGFAWLGHDAEDGYKLQYLYRIDNEAWSSKTSANLIFLKDLQRSNKLTNGYHIFEVKAEDSGNKQSESKKLRFLFKK